MVESPEIAFPFVLHLPLDMMMNDERGNVEILLKSPG